MDINIFYKILSSPVQYITKHKVLIIGGNMKADIDDNKFSLNNKPKRKS